MMYICYKYVVYQCMSVHLNQYFNVNKGVRCTIINTNTTADANANVNSNVLVSKQIRINLNWIIIDKVRNGYCEYIIPSWVYYLLLNLHISDDPKIVLLVCYNLIKMPTRIAYNAFNINAYCAFETNKRSCYSLTLYLFWFPPKPPN